VQFDLLPPKNHHRPRLERSPVLPDDHLVVSRLPCSLKPMRRLVPPGALSSTSASSDISAAQTLSLTWKRRTPRPQAPAPNTLNVRTDEVVRRSPSSASSIRTPRSTSSRRNSAKRSRSALVLSSASRGIGLQKTSIATDPNPDSTFEAQTTKKRTKPIPRPPK